MNQSERRVYLIEALLRENPKYRGMPLPKDRQGQKDLLRALMNVRMPGALSDEYQNIEGEYLTQENAEKGIVSIDELTPVQEGIYLWQGDITRLSCDAIVNAANSELLGCFHPLHSCIDNCIHSAAGLSLRNACYEIMQRQGHEEPTGQAKITSAYHLPSRYVIHTVGPIVSGKLTATHCEELASCYRSCFHLAEENGLHSIAYCCISTGVFGFPQREAAEIAVRTVKECMTKAAGDIRVIFNVFTDKDKRIYEQLLTDAN